MMLRTIGRMGLLSILVAGCGGGGSSSGGGTEVSTDVSSCISVDNATPPPISLTDPLSGEVTTFAPITTLRYVNTCSFTVNAAIHFEPTIAYVFFDEFTLAPGQSEVSYFNYAHTACRPPSKPILLGNTNGEKNTGCS